MTVSLLGIGGLQWYWLTSAYAEKEAEFDRSVEQALTSTVQELEQKQTEIYIDRSLTNEFIPELTVLMREYKEGRWPQDEEYRVLEPSANDQDGEKTEIIIWSDEDSAEIDHDIQIITESGDPTQNTYTITRYESQDTMYSDTVIHRRQIEHRVNVVEDVLGKMIVAELTSKDPLNARLVVCDIDSLVSQKLAGQGIHADYELDVPDSTSNLMRSLAPQFSTSLFPGMDQLYHYRLGISFPAKDSVVLGSMSAILFLAIGLTLIMVFTFGFTVYYILRQKKISQMKTDFINNMTHEFKTPLATIRLAADSIRHPEVSGNLLKVNYYLDVIQDENTRLSAHVENVLQIARMEKEELKLNIVRVNLNELVQRVATSMDIQVRSKEGSIVTNLEGTDLSINGDQNHLYNAILNLVDNAIKYCKNPPSISLRTERQGDHVLLEVLDNGIGMSKEVQSRIFKTFYRAQQGNLHEVKGFGLGLSYVKTIVERHSGEILVESALGKGTRIGIILPLS
jgi:two-component system, OmpR family, phosphate regulon sensor histidine kinase PhoR